MPNLKSLKALKKLMQEEGLLKQVEKMASVPDKHGIISGQAMEAVRDAKKYGLNDPSITKQLRDARQDTIRKDAILDLEDRRMIEPDLNTVINRRGAEEAWSKMADELNKKSRFQKTRELIQRPVEESDFAKQAAVDARREVNAGLSEEQAFLKTAKKLNLSNQDYREMVRLFGKGSSE